MTIKIEEMLNKEKAYAIYLDEKKVFSVGENEEISQTVLNECFNIVTLLEKVYKHGRQGNEITFGIRDA